ncbi:MAG: phosphoglucomutase [Thermodesulfobacteriota bacterium]
MSLPDVSYLYRNLSTVDHTANDYFQIIKTLVQKNKSYQENSSESAFLKNEINKIYELIKDEIKNNENPPVNQIKFGTSGWRGILGKDISCSSVARVTQAIIKMYQELRPGDSLSSILGSSSLEEFKRRGCVVGHDNRFGGDLLLASVTDVLTSHGFTVHQAGETTTGAISAAVLELGTAFSVNLTPSHNPLEYGGYKFNGPDAGPALPLITDRITKLSREIMKSDNKPAITPRPELVKQCNSLALWKKLVRKNKKIHGLDYDDLIKTFSLNKDCVLAIDAMYGATKVHLKELFKDTDTDRLIFIRDTDDPTFGGIAPEPSPANMKEIKKILNKRPEPLKLGVVMDPDGDRIRFTDGKQDISMNYFGAMAYHYLHEVKGKKGLVAKTVATSNFADSIARALGEDVFEPKVGFKEFKPVIGKALVCFEESDGISIIGHTPEKDAYIGIIIALDMTLRLGKNLSKYLEELQQKFGVFFPDKDGIIVDKHGEELENTLAALNNYSAGDKLAVGQKNKVIKDLLTVDGHKFIFEDKSWLMIRASGTEPKVRFYVEGRNEKDRENLFTTASQLLSEIGLSKLENQE